MCNEEGLRIPDHSVLTLKVHGVDSFSHYDSNPALRESSETYVVPEGYMLNETSFIHYIIHDLKLVAGDQGKLDEVYGELCDGLRRGLKAVNCRRKKTSQPWFTANLAELRNSMHKSEARWLKCTTGDDRVVYRNEYLKARQSYSKAVKKAKRISISQTDSARSRIRVS